MDFLVFVMGVVWLVSTIASRRRLKSLDARVTELAQENARHIAAGTVLHKRIEALRLRLDAELSRLPPAMTVTSPTAGAPSPPIAAPATPPLAESRVSEPGESRPTMIAEPTADLVALATPAAATPQETAMEASVPGPEPRGPSEAIAAAVALPEATPVVEAVTGVVPEGAATNGDKAPPTIEATEASAPPPAPPPPPETVTLPSPEVPAPPPRRGLDWESLVGVRLFSWISGIALVMGAVLFLRYSIEQGLLGPPIRLAIGILTGVALLVVSETRGRSKWNVTADALGAAGIAILFATFFAADALWHLLPQAATFGLMVLVTTVAVLLAVRHNSVFIALLGLVGGFATPVLLSTGEDRPLGLFGYLLVLNVGLAWVGRRRGWTVLIALSVAFTAVYQWGWVIKFVFANPAELPIAVAAFLVFPVLVAVSRLVPPRDDAAPAVAFERTAAVSALLPLLFALCFAWVPTFAEHYVLLFGYLFLLDTALGVIAVATRSRLLFGAAALATVLVFAGWLPAGYGPEAWPGLLGFVALFVALFLLAPFGAQWATPRLDALREARGRPPIDAKERPPVSLEGARSAAPLLLFTFPALVFLEPAASAPLLVFGVMFVLLAGIAAVALLAEAGGLYFLAAFFAIVAEATWSAEHLGPTNLHAALLLYGAFGLFHLGVPLLARRFGKKLEPAFGPPALLLASLALLLFLAAGPVAHLALWGMAILLAILNLGLFFDRRPGPVSWLAGIGMMLSWVVIAVWWASAMVASLLLPALAIVGGFAVLLVGGNLWADGHASGAVEGAGRRGVYLGLVGHLFLLFVASQAGLAAPPWPLLGVLFVLDLAILVAAIYARRAELHVATMGASQLVIFVWVIVAHGLPSSGLPWPEVGVLATLGVMAMALGAIPLARRRNVTGAPFPAAAAVATLGAMCVIGAVGASHEAPSIAWLVLGEATALVALAWLAAETEWHWMMVVAVFLSFASTGVWTVAAAADGPRPWLSLLIVAGVPYAIWLANPVWLGARALSSRSPHIAAVLASGAFFVFGREALLAGGYGSIIGALPVVQALLLVGSLAHLVRLSRATTDESARLRDRGRLALVAGAALAFVTAAIPLQLDKQWITIGWGLEAAALAWLYRRVVHKGLLGTSAALAIAVVLRLSLNRAVFSYHPRGAHPIVNWYLYAYLVSAVALLGAASLLAEANDRFDRFPALPRVSSLMRAGGTLLLFLLLNIQIADYWSTGSEITFNFSSDIAQDLTYTIGWAFFAIAVLVVGIVRKSRAPRLAALLLLVITVAKAFLHDLWRLGGLYRVGSFVGLALSLALVAVVLQRFVLAPDTKKNTP